MDFRFGSRSHGGLPENAIKEMARKNPGKLLKSGLRTMWSLCHPVESASGARPVMPATAVDYLQRILKQTRNQPLGRRDSRELQTLATALDLLSSGELERMGDVIIQRFKAIEASTQDVPFRVSNQFELCQPDDAQATTTQEREAAACAFLREAKLEQAMRR